MYDKPKALEKIETPEQVLAKIRESLINARPQNALEDTLLDYEKMLEKDQAQENSKYKRSK
jgi:hypothetical protein